MCGPRARSCAHLRWRVRRVRRQRRKLRWGRVGRVRRPRRRRRRVGPQRRRQRRRGGRRVEYEKVGWGRWGRWEHGGLGRVRVMRREARRVRSWVRRHVMERRLQRPIPLTPSFSQPAFRYLSNSRRESQQKLTLQKLISHKCRMTCSTRTCGAGGGMGGGCGVGSLRILKVYFFTFSLSSLVTCASPSPTEPRRLLRTPL